MSRFIGTPTKETDKTMSQSRRNNPMFRSQFLTNSVHKEIQTDVRHSFFHDNPFQRIRNDLTKYKPISYQSPAKVKSRSFVIVDEQVKYGQPLTAEQFEALISNKTSKRHSIVTYGSNNGTNLKDNGRVIIDVKNEDKQQRSGWCCCGDDRPKEKTLAERYE